MISVLLVSRTPTSRQRLHLDVVGASADALPGLSTYSAVGALVAHAVAGLSVSCAVGALAAAGGTGVVWRKKLDRAWSTGSNSRRHRERVLPTAMAHAFARPLHLLHPHVAGVYMLWYARTPVETACLLVSRYHPGDILGVSYIMRHDTAGGVVHDVPGS